MSASLNYKLIGNSAGPLFFEQVKAEIKSANKGDKNCQGKNS